MRQVVDEQGALHDERKTGLTVRLQHGDRCSCKLLALAVGLDPRALSYEYCRRVLQKRWRMTCRHGECSGDAVAADLGEHWRGVASIDPVKAILISNDPWTD